MDKNQKGVFFISGFLIKPLINKNCHNSRNGIDIDMKVGPLTMLDMRNMTKSKKFDDGVMSVNYDVIFFFQFYDQFGDIWKPDSRWKVHKF